MNLSQQVRDIMNAVKLTLCKRETFRRKYEPIRYEYTSVLLVQDSKKNKTV